MKKRILGCFLVASMMCSLFSGCGKSTTEEKSDTANATEQEVTVAAEDNTEIETETPASETEEVETQGGTMNLGGDITLAAAASLQNVFEDKLIPMFNETYKDVKVTGTYASSGDLQTQIENGLDADLFFSAATKQMTALNEGGYIKSDSIVNLLENKIVLIVPKGSEDGFSSFEDITKAATIAIGDPESVPAGQYAKEALTNLNLWDSVSGKASFGTKVTEVLAWVAAGSANAGIVYATDAASEDGVTVVAKAPEGSLEKPVIYPVATLANSKNPDAATAFLEFLQTDEAKEVFESYGFTISK